MADITVFVISVTDHHLPHALKTLENQQKTNCDFEIKHIRNVYPMSEAFNHMLDDCETKYFIQMDEDMGLNDKMLKHMYDTIVKLRQDDDKIALACFPLKDPEFGNLLGVKIYYHPICNKFRHKHVSGTGRLYNQELLDAGYKIAKPDPKYIVGTHALHRTDFELFLRYIKIGQKIRVYGPKNGFHLILMKKTAVYCTKKSLLYLWEKISTRDTLDGKVQHAVFKLDDNEDTMKNVKLQLDKLMIRYSAMCKIKDGELKTLNTQRKREMVSLCGLLFGMCYETDDDASKSVEDCHQYFLTIFRESGVVF